MRAKATTYFGKAEDIQARRIATQKALRELPKCEYTEGCEGKGMGILAKLDPFRLVLACPACAQRAKDAPRSGT